MYQNQKLWFYLFVVFLLCALCFTALFYYNLVRFLLVAKDLHISALWLVVSGAFIAFVYVFAVVVYFVWGWDQDPGDVPETIKQPPTPDRTLTEINFFFRSPAGLSLNVGAVLANIVRLMFKGKVRVDYDEHNVYFYINDAVQLDLSDEEKHTLEFIKCFRYDDQKGAYYVQYNPQYYNGRGSWLPGFKKKWEAISARKKLESTPRSKEFNMLSTLGSDIIVLFSFLLLFSASLLLAPAPEHPFAVMNTDVLNGVMLLIARGLNFAFTPVALAMLLFGVFFLRRLLENLIGTLLHGEPSEKFSVIFLLLVVVGSIIVFWYSWLPSGIYTMVAMQNAKFALIGTLFFLSCTLGTLGGSGLYVKWKHNYYKELLEWQAFKNYITKVDDPRVFTDMDEKEFHKLFLYILAVEGQVHLYSLYPASKGFAPVQTKFQKLMRTVYLLDQALSQGGVSDVFN